jgi:hypothetical protein
MSSSVNKVLSKWFWTHFVIIQNKLYCQKLNKLAMDFFLQIITCQIDGNANNHKKNEIGETPFQHR